MVEVRTIETAGMVEGLIPKKIAECMMAVILKKVVAAMGMNSYWTVPQESLMRAS